MSDRAGHVLRLPTVAVALLGAALALGGCGERKRAAAGPALPAAPPALSGAEIYETYCAVCHMSDGSGVPNFQPALRGNALVAGDPARLEAVIRAGSAALTNRETKYAAEMPPFGSLSDDEIRAIVAYVRERFGAGSSGPAP